MRSDVYTGYRVKLHFTINITYTVATTLTYRYIMTHLLWLGTMRQHSDDNHRPINQNIIHEYRFYNCLLFQVHRCHVEMSNIRIY